MQTNPASPSKPGTNSLLGVRIWPHGLEHLIDSSLAAIARATPARQPYVFACANPHSFTVADRDPVFKSALREADAVVADGVGVKIAANLCGRTLGPRITGIDYFRALMSALNRRGDARVAYFGSQASVLDKLVARGGAAFPRVKVVKAISPPYGDWSADANQNFIDQINESQPDVLWVGMTAPKQEKWVRANLHLLQCGAVGSIGAVFDYFAGTVRRAPEWVCGMGLEWAYRLSREPKRLWQRTFVSAPQFLGLAMNEALRGHDMSHALPADNTRMQ
jgi:N-acetylglucosaminyldiphosphoundecaprenol N-acetyl-beta-D-mannosaminyltransferase